MWQAPNQRLRAISNKKKREQERLRRPIHIRRVLVHIEVLGTEGAEPVKVEARLILNDIGTKGAGFFSTQKLVATQVIKMTIDEPTPLQIYAKVVWCQEQIVNNHILSASPHSYRVGVEFILKSEEDKKLIQNFFEQIGKNYLYSNKVP